MSSSSRTGSRNRNTVEFLGIWEKVNNPDFNCVEFDTIKSNAGLNSYRRLLIIPLHTDAIKANLIPEELTAKQTSIVYASEADVLNVALYGITAKQWREANPELKGNIRDYNQ